MSKIRLVTDSTADIPETAREAYGIEVVPLKVHFGHETYMDQVTMHSEQFYEKLSQTDTLPTTSQPSPVDFIEAYKRVLSADPDAQIISLHLASALSGTYQSATLAKSLLEDRADITLIDSKSASYGIGMLVIAAAEAARNGASKEECLELIQRMRRETKLYFLVDTLEYLRKGGRIGKASALLGSLLNIKPVLSIDDNGEVYPVDRVRGHKKAMNRIVELLKNELADGEVDITVAHSHDRSGAEQFAALLQEHFRVRNLNYTSLGPVIGTHTGPGTLAVFAVPC